MFDTLAAVKEFHQKFDCSINDQPFIEDEGLNTLRVDFLSEEVSELEEALIARDPVEVLDALIDIQYVLDGAFLALGFHRMKDVAFEEVQRSNMSKLGSDGKPVRRSDGKVLKGPNFSPPDLKKVIELFTK